jgi:putative aminopeptidase FrvX
LDGLQFIPQQGQGKSKISNIFIDLGCENKKKWKKLGVHVGCVVHQMNSWF